MNARIRTLVGIAVVSGCSLAGAAPAAAGPYVAVQCDRDRNPLAQDAVTAGNLTDYGMSDSDCLETNDDGLRVRNLTRARDDSFGLWRLQAPDGTSITGASVRSRLETDEDHEAQLYVSEASPSGGDVGVRVIAEGSDDPETRNYSWSGIKRRLSVRLRCEPSDGPACHASRDAEAWMKNIELTLTDSAPPSLTASGALIGGGWRSGAEPLEVAASDRGSGVRGVELLVNGAPAGGRTFDCETIGSGSEVRRLSPCAPEQRASLTADPARAAFSEGENRVSACVVDYSPTAPNRICRDHSVSVDTEPPEAPQGLVVDGGSEPRGTNDFDVRWSNPLGQRSPITGAHWRLRDPNHDVSGFTPGDGITRLSDLKVPESGTYELSVWLQDAAGNRSEEHSSQVTLSYDDSLPVDSKLTAGLGDEDARRLRVDYGEGSEVTGALRDGAGDPLADQELTVTETFAAGALEPVRSSTVRTDPEGRYALDLESGPSRTVEVAFAGSPRNGPSTSTPVELEVSSGVTLRVERRVREGRRATFEGKVKRRGAEIPSKGKVVEIQVREPGRGWRTVKQAFTTESDGTYRLRYRFHRFYVRPTTFRFRTRVTPEEGWPYATPVHSRERRVTVLPR